MKVGKKLDLDAMSTDEMWQLHMEIDRLLSTRLTLEKRELEKRLARLRRENEIPPTEAIPVERNLTPERRKYPRVLPKYQNPNKPTETWSGRGKQPRWLAAALNTGHSIEEFVIGNLGPRSVKGRQHDREI